MQDVHSRSSLPTSILVPIHFSSSAQAALDAASDLAEHFQASLILVNVVPCLSFFARTYAIPDDALRRRTWEHAERLAAKCRLALTARGVNSRCSVEFGNNVARAIIDVAGHEHFDKAVISTHGISGWHPSSFARSPRKSRSLCNAHSCFSAPPIRRVVRRALQGAPWNGSSGINGTGGQW